MLMCPAVAGAQQDDATLIDPSESTMVSEEASASPSEQIFAQLDSTAAPAVVEEASFVERPEDQMYIVEVVAREDFILSQGIQIYFDETDVLVPLGALSAALQFPITVDSAAGTASGWFATPDNTFALTKPFKTVTIAGKQITPTGVIENHIDDIYVTTRDFEAWFPVKVDFKFNELRLHVTPSVPLPFEELAAREKRWDRLKGAADKTTAKDDYKDVIFLPYKTWSNPSFQISHNLNATTSPADSTRTFVTSVQATNDLFGRAARLNASINAGDLTTKGLNNISFRMSKEDYRGYLLGKMQATEYSFGDVDATPFPLADGPLQGRGGTVSNAPANFVRDINNFVVTGFAPVGWDVELYQDQQLLDFIRIGSDGRYDFTEIELREGFNLFRIVLYGPNGEKEERYERFYLGQNMVEKGKFIYNLSGLQSTAPLFNVDDQAEDTGMLSALGEYGLTDNVSVYGGLYNGVIGNTQMTGLGSGMRLSSKRFYTQLSALGTNTGGVSGDITTTGNLSDTITVGAGHTEHRNYKPGDRGVVQETYARFSQMFSFKFLQFGSYGFEAKTSLSDTDVRTNTLSNRIGASFLGMNLTNDITHVTNDTPTNEAKIDGELTLRYRTGLGLWRGRLNYAMDDRDSLQSGELGLQTNITPELFLNLGFNAQFTDTREKTFLASLDREFKKFKLGVQGAVTTEDEVRVGMTLTYNLIPKSLQGGYMMTGNTQALNNGTLELVPYIDENGDGQFSQGEEQVAGVTFRNQLRGGKALSNEQGIATLDGIAPSNINTVSIDVKTLPDIYMTPGLEQLRIFGKPGFSGPIYYPISLLGEISGTLLSSQPVDTGIEQSDVAGALGAVQIVLLDQNDQVVAETYSEYDGFFSFQSLPLGQYRIYVPASPLIDGWFTGDRNGPSVTLTADNTEINTLELTVNPSGITSRQ